MQQDFPKAEEYFNEALAYFKPLLDDPAKTHQFLERYCRISIQLAHSYAKRGILADAQVLYKEIIQICSDEGFTSTLELAMSGNGLAHVLNGHEKEGLEIFVSAYPVAKLFGSIDRVRSLFFLVCSWTNTVEGNSKAKNFYDNEIEFIKDKTGFERPFEEIPERLIKDYKYK